MGFFRSLPPKKRSTFPTLPCPLLAIPCSLFLIRLIANYTHTTHQIPPVSTARARPGNILPKPIPYGIHIVSQIMFQVPPPARPFRPQRRSAIAKNEHRCRILFFFPLALLVFNPRPLPRLVAGAPHVVRHWWERQMGQLLQIDSGISTHGPFAKSD